MQTENSMKALFFKGNTIRCEGEMFCLTDMWRGSGADDGRKPAQWLRSDIAKAFVEHIDSVENCRGAINHLEIVRVIRGGSGPHRGETWAHWQVAMAYAKYLSPEFHVWCNEVVRDHLAQKAAEAKRAGPSLEDGFRAVQAGCAMVGEDALILGQMRRCVRQAARTQGLHIQAILGMLSRRLRVTSYLRMPMTLAPIAFGMLHELADGAATLARRISFKPDKLVASDPRQLALKLQN